MCWWSGPGANCWPSTDERATVPVKGRLKLVRISSAMCKKGGIINKTSLATRFRFIFLLGN